MRTASMVLLLAGLCAAAPGGHQVQIVPQEGCAYYSRALPAEIYTFKPDSTVTAQVTNMLALAAAAQDFELAAANVPLVTAVRAADRRFILYNQYAAATAANQDRWHLLAMLAHQTGHHVFSHSLEPGESRRQQELDADKFSGTILHLMGAELNAASAALRDRSKTAADPGYPTLDARLRSVEDGWKSSEPITKHGFATAESLPRFDLPPPKSSAVVPVPLASWRPGSRRTLGDVAARLADVARTGGGYQDMKYWAVRDGFAAATAVEQINDDGSPRPKNRWSLEISPPRIFSVQTYINALFSAASGRYRFFVFVVSPHPLGQRPVEMKFQPSIDWLWTGLNDLPPSVKSRTVTGAYQCTALIYEFEQAAMYSEVVLRSPSALNGRTHLEMARLWPGLVQ